MRIFWGKLKKQNKMFLNFRTMRIVYLDPFHTLLVGVSFHDMTTLNQKISESDQQFSIRAYQLALDRHTSNQVTLGAARLVMQCVLVYCLIM